MTIAALGSLLAFSAFCDPTTGERVDDDDDGNTPSSSLTGSHSSSSTNSPSPTATNPLPTPTANACRTESDCPDPFMICLRPGEPLPCGPAPPPDECSTDGECLGALVCQLDLWPGCAAPPRLFCATACTTDGDCGLANLKCELGHCRERTCDEGRSCDAPATCPTGDPACHRPTCLSDRDCGPPWICVRGSCYDDFGTCSYIPP